MEVVSLCSLPVASIAWQPRAGTHVLTVVVKATFALTPGESKLARDHEPPTEADEHWSDDEAKSLRLASDLAPFKPRAEVVLTGLAYAPRGQPAASVMTRLVVGEVDKSIEVCCDRAFTQEGQLREGARFVKMPLVYERAGGGPDTWNPVGVRADARPDRYGMVALPNLVAPGRFVIKPGDHLDPIGYGPIAPTWPGRANKLYAHAATFPHKGWHERPLPEIDPAYFLVAPLDQQLDVLRPNERVVLENLTPTEPRFVTSLAGAQPRGRVERRGAAEDLALRCDTLILDTETMRASLVWRAQIVLDHPQEAGRVVITMDGDARLAPAGAPLRRTSFDASQTMGAEESTGVDIHVPATALPFRDFDEESPPETVGPDLLRASAARAHGAPSWLAQGAGAPQPGPSAPRAPTFGAPPAPVFAQTSAVFTAPPGAATMPVFNTPAPAAPFAPSAPQAAPPFAQSAPQPLFRPAIAPEPAAPAFVPPAWSPSDPRAPDAGLSIGQRVAQSADAPPAARPGVLDGVASASSQAAGQRLTPSAARGSVPPPPVVAAIAKDAAIGGVVAASNAAAVSEPRAASIDAASAEGAAPRADAGTVVKLLWYDPACLPDLRAHPKWKAIIAATKAKPKSDDDWFAEDAEMEEPAESKERRHIAAVLTRASPIDAAGVNEALLDAVDADGLLTTPLVLVSGELVFPFDELEVLKATVTAVTPLAGGDKRLKEVLDTTAELFKTAWLKSSGGVAEGLTLKIREAFAQGNRMVPASYVEGLTERVLLEQRAYQKRVVFGKPTLRSLLQLEGASEPIPAYLPEDLAKELPMMQRLRARVIAEVHMAQDQYEPHPAALRVVALARTGALTARRGGRKAS